MAYRLKYGAIVGIVAVSALMLIAATQPWFIFTVTGTATTHTLTVSGSTAAPALTAFGLASLVLAAALTIAGTFSRVVLSILGITLAVCAFFSVLGAILDPGTAGAPAVTEATGIAGTQSVHALIIAVDTFAWPAVTVIASCALAALGALVGVTSTRWPRSSTRHEAVRMVAADASADTASIDTPPTDTASTDTASTDTRHRDAFTNASTSAAASDQRNEEASVDDWDTLTRGHDPTR